MEPGIVGVTVDREQIENERLRHAITGISRVVPVTPTAVNIEQARAKLLTAGLTEGYEESARALASWALEYGIALLAAIDELEATVTVAESEIAELEAARDRVLALHKKQYAGPFQSTPAGPRYWCEECNVTWPCETVRTVTP
jgi:hypothetical protein